MGINRYRITVEMVEDNAAVPRIAVIECETTYMMREDLSEWVVSEIDPAAIVLSIPVGSCVECAGGRHRGCGGVPDCPCAMVGHS